MKKLIVLTFFLAIVTLCGAVAQTVQVVLMHVVPDGTEGVASLSEFIVNGCLDALFAGGLIGTNARPVDAPANRFAVYRPEAALEESYVSHVLLILAEYPEPGSSGAGLPDCSFRLVTVRGNDTLAQGNLAAFIPESASALAVEKACSEMGAAMVRSCAGAW
ncbi:MAG: hypothetical protein E4H20_01275 [Spirochaetales bacterium]|nr:MAG: hypothetical protein E4H20_01275 [Spirochaetales bacterium]